MIVLNTDAEKQIDRLIVSLEQIDFQKEVGSAIVRTVALNVLAEMRFRIQNQQTATNGSIIGQYSTKPLYVSLKDSPGGSSLGRPLGKPVNGKRSSKFKSGKDHTSRYFGRGYKQYKERLYPGLKGVNLTLTGTMMNQMTVLKTEDGWGIGWANVEFADRARYFENKKYNKRIFGASRKERLIAVRTAKRLINNALLKGTS